MTMLFGKTKATINEHIKNIYAEEELDSLKISNPLKIMQHFSLVASAQ